MPLYALALFAAILGYDQLGYHAQPAGPITWASLLALKALFALDWWRRCRSVTSSWNKPDLTRRITRLHRAGELYGPIAICLLIADLGFGTLESVRNTLGDYVLTDELITLAPTFALIIWRWIPYEPIDRWTREATFTRRLMEGKPTYPSGTPTQYVTDQIRHQLGPILLPMILIVGWLETLNFMHPEPTTASILLITGVLAVLLLSAPLIISIWNTRPVNSPELRQDLEDLCRHQRVRPGGFRLWITEGRMANAAVLGILWPFRYLLISDTILDHLPKDEVMGVLAHEVAHLRQRHAFWLGLGTLAIAGSLEALIQFSPWGPQLAEAAASGNPTPTQTILLTALPILTVFPWILGTGYLSRRFERQADAAGARELSTRLNPDAHTVTPEAASIMAHALDEVALLNGMNPAKFMWRHGSIRERQRHLQSLVGKPLTALPIDKRVNHLRILITALTLAGITLASTSGLL